MNELQELEERLERLIKKRNKQIAIAGLASKKTVDAISRLRIIIENFPQKDIDNGKNSTNEPKN